MDYGFEAIKALAYLTNFLSKVEVEKRDKLIDIAIDKLKALRGVEFK